MLFFAPHKSGILYPMEEQEKFSSLESMHQAKSGAGEAVAVVEASAEPVTTKKDRFLPMSILVAAFVIGGSVVFATFYRGGWGAAPAGQGGNNPPAPTIDAGKLGPRDVIWGNANAPVTLIEYGDYQCPFCGMFFTQIQPTLKKNYIDPGKVKMLFSDFPFLRPQSIS